MANIPLLQLLNFQDLLLFFVSLDSKLNIFRLWAVGWTKHNLKTSYWMEHFDGYFFFYQYSSVIKKVIISCSPRRLY